MIWRKKTPILKDEAQATGFDSFELRLGDMMRGERATMGKSLLDVQRELKIQASYISAIEEADAKGISAQGFTAGYVRSYARYLGLDPDVTFKMFCEESGFKTAHGLAPGVSIAAEKAACESQKSNDQKRKYGGDPLANPNASWVPQSESVFSRVEPGAVGSIALLMTMVGVLGFGGWSVLQEIQRVDFAPIEQSPGVLAELPAFDSRPIEQGVGAAGELVATAQTVGLPSLTSDETWDRIYRPKSLDVPVLTHRDAPISTLDPTNVGVLANAVAPSFGGAFGDIAVVNNPNLQADLGVENTTHTPVQVLGADAADVVVFAVRPAWIRIKSADGTVVFEKILDAGEHYSLPKTEQASFMRSGNAGSVYFAVNGTAYGPAGDGASVVKNVELSQVTLVENYAQADMTRDAALATYVAELQVTE